MIKNLEIVILKPNKIYEPEKFNGEFSAIAYYYLVKIRKIKIPLCSYIKIWVKNSDKEEEFSYELLDGILFIQFAIDFSHYLKLSHIQKLKFQYELVFSILKYVFTKYNLDWKILDEVNSELAANNWQMKYEFVRKKIAKGKDFKLMIYMDIDVFTFIGEVIQNDERKEIPIFKTIPTFFAVEYFFKGYRFFDNKVRIGSKEKAVFEIDFENETVTIVDNNKMLNELKYK